MKVIKAIGKIVLGLVVVWVALFGLGYVLTIGKYTVPETVARDPSMPSITIDGYTYHAETYGDPANPVVITLHSGLRDDYRSILALQALTGFNDDMESVTTKPSVVQLRHHILPRRLNT